MGHRFLVHAAVGTLLIASASPGFGQTRAAAAEERQAEKARTAEPEETSRTELFFEQLEQGKWFIGVPRGWYPMFGSIYPGGGLAGGGGYRHDIGYDSYIDVSAMASIRNYKRVAIVGSTPNHVKGHLDMSGSISWLDATQVPFFGLGNDSDREDRTNFRITRTQVEGTAMLHLVDWLRLRLDGGFDDYRQKPGRGAYPPIETVFSRDTTPGLGENALYLRGEASATVYWLQSPGYSRRGGLYRFAYEEFNPLRGDGGTFGFARTEIVQHVPILRETWVLSLRGRTESIVRKSDVVPYFLMPSLGGGSTLRGYTTGRFRDRHALLLTSELRWFPNRAGLDMALFFDAGKVAPRRNGLTLSDMETDCGIGVRFHTLSATVLRVELARGLEGWRTVFAVSSAF